MGWLIKIDGHEVSSDDLTLDDLDALEKATGTPWSALNPWRHATHAREFIRRALVLSGVPQEDADARADNLRLSDIKGAFDFVDDTTGEREASPDIPLGRSSRSSSRGGPRGSGGPRRKPAGSGSGTSSS